MQSGGKILRDVCARPKKGLLIKKKQQPSFASDLPSHIGSVLRAAHFLVRVETIADLFMTSGPMQQYYYTNIISLYLHVSIFSHGIII